MSNRYYTSKNMQCKNCNKNGHLSTNCPEPRKLTSCFLCGIPGHRASGCPSKHCNNCGLPGHLYSSCSDTAYWKKWCKRCGGKGHIFDACPEIWRQYHITVCNWKRMFNGVFPNSPVVNYYDKKKDIRHRENWIESKVIELKKKGFFLTSSFQTPTTPEPPSKKQKVGHHQHPNHTPRQSPNKHKPNHVFFNDSDFVEAAATKAKKNNKHKQQESHVKPWKPKRPVPASRDRRPVAKLIVDEAEDFPRGGGKVKDAEKKKKRLRKKKPPKAATSPQESLPKQPKVKRSRKKKNDAQMYPTDENLFIIKQRKGKK
ncbi:Zinc finger CCHC domain-containing protein 7 [Liparis tanakae]|uniref:Zinc finger CCHC domain-containing protein 7 n=1 Tax=Liparis tanakae TaxID=230148 RepID=A0A4Z2HUC4_9TELE|nr:Zinc finger CCHC domain-containing protein 7 [Liparis tanakae]